MNRWVVEYAPKLESKFSKKHKRGVGTSWQMDETYVKVKSRWCYLYRAVDKAGNTVDFMLSKYRDKVSAKRFFNKSIGQSGLPQKVTVDKSGSNRSALTAINAELSGDKPIEIRQIKYLNNIVEQDHRFIKKIVKPMMSFKAMDSAEATLRGIELYHMLRKNQHCNPAHKTVFQQFYALAA